MSTTIYQLIPILINIADIYVRSFCICLNFIDSIISESKSQHKILSFHKVKPFLLKKKSERTLTTNMLSSLENDISFVSDI